MELANSKAVPITILTGFLGAGKTTLLNRILTGEHGLRVAVLVNDFGSINIDAELVVGVESNMISLANGCVCCSIRDDLLDAIWQVLKRPEQPEYILLEASGVADPKGIIVTFYDGGLRERLRLDSITCVVDAENLFAVPELMELKLLQVACSDMLILNKVDLVDRLQIEKIKEWLDSRLYRYRLVEASHCDVPLEILLSVGRFDPAQAMLEDPGKWHAETGGSNGHGDHQHDDHTQVFSTWSYETDQPMSLEALHKAASKLPVAIYRAKGVIYSSDAPERRAVLQVVGKRVDISLQDGWGERPRRTQIVAIGASNGVEMQLRDKFEMCISA